MNFNKLSKEKKQQLILVALVTIGSVALLGFGLITRQYQNLHQLAEKRTAADRKLQQIQDAVKRADRTEVELAEARTKLAEAEADIASGDLYSWVITTFRRFKAGYKVDIPQFSPIGAVTDVNLLPDFPYKQANLAVAGTARFHDFGRFLADLENQFPHIRVLNLTLEPNGSPGLGQEETLAFRMDLAVLVKPNPS